ncbi:MAG TPA: ABC transporter permease [Thermoanaerobaculia bacterium]|nr:ABC transporter permease [Thermoanaerobaculia bacterium]
MTHWLSQIGALTAFNLKTIGQRRGAAATAAVGIAFVVAVLVGVLSIARGFQRTMTVTGSPDTAVVLRAGSDSEMTSVLSKDETELLAEAPGVARGASGALVSPELFVILNLPKRSTGTDANVPLRGVRPAAFEVRGEVEIIAGRPFAWGRNEVIVGRRAQSQFAGLDLGAELELGQSRWRVVGVFAADGGLAESEVWADAAVVQPAYRRGSSFQIATVQLASAGSFQAFKDALTTDPRVNVKVVRETEYYAEQSTTMVMLITGLGLLIGVLMGLGALFGALNTMYTAVAARAREIATLRALGFRASPVVVSVLLESLAVALVGAVVGAALAWAAFDGYTTATLNWRSFSQVAFAFEVDLPLLGLAILYALGLGLLGGLLPAIRAARMPIARALREG